ncbi:hypothetical protein [Neobacillus sp. D3-1R]|uniref:hypothetical protein n=1 Tax=Neobacillus sp. D3-1R TaxID=3445778 RepID=UPI003FA101C0
MRRFFRIDVFVLMAFVLMTSFALPQGKVLGAAKTQIHLHIKGGELAKDSKVTLEYKVKEKKKDKKDKHEHKGKDKEIKKTLEFTRQNGTLYKASKPSGFEASKNVTFSIKLGSNTDTYAPTKVTGSKGTVNYWIDVKNKNEDENKEDLTTFTKNEPLIPLVKDVYNNGDGTYTVYWGYDNQNDVTVDAISSQLTSAYVFNNASPLKKGFTEGKVEEAFKTTFTGPSISWELTGPDGVKRTATALAGNSKTYKSLQPFVKGVYKNTNGTYTAYFGYQNENAVEVDAKISQYVTPALNYSVPMKTGFVPGTVNEAFKSTFSSTTLSWNLVGPNGASYTAVASVNNAINYGTLTPIVKAVYDNGDGTFTAYFGYQNGSGVTVDALESKFISGTVLNNGQPMKKDFLSGTNQEAFSVVFKGTYLMWALAGPDGQTKYVVASSNNAPKYSALLPNVNKVVNNGDGTFTAIWGYQNLNGVTLSAKESTFKGTVLKNESAMINDFKPGIQTNAFETTFKGAEFTWQVKGQDGVIRVVTAYSKNAVTR